MKKGRLSFSELVQRNKDELLRDKQQVAKIEERIDEKHAAKK
ncbi:FbpB family small basic protein [Aquibacillus halophilus]|uniref:FbpB family small basic protein n=1 Tax=Aquibacillus halophilus TaxID=930132 RepID=A0A6A8DKQ4_9BACI|nr:FbpB family small basic protein [Aquibacillus halophilus]MRH45056.1 FbpB family small basic protein [Aquibacillus halophilus]